MNARGCAIPTIRSQNIALGIINVLYGYEESVHQEGISRYDSCSNVDDYISRARAQPGANMSAAQIGNLPSHGHNPEKKASECAHRLSFRWKEATKFSGAIGSVPGFHQMKQMYQDAVEYYKIPARERVYLLHHILKDTAYNFFHVNVNGHVAGIAEAYAILEAQFCSAASQHSTKTLLDSFQI
jgi:hypothetical protein